MNELSEFSQLLVNGGMAMLLLEAGKWLYRFLAKKPEYNFPPAFYVVAIPTLNVLVIPLLYLLGVEGVALPTDWLGWVQSAVLVGVGSLVSLLFYNGGLSKLKEYSKAYRLENGENKKEALDKE